MKPTLPCVLAAGLFAAAASAQELTPFPIDCMASGFEWRAQTPAGTTATVEGMYEGTLELALTGTPVTAARITEESLVRVPDLSAQVTFPPAGLATQGVSLRIITGTFAVSPATGAFSATLTATFTSGMAMYHYGGMAGVWFELTGAASSPAAASGTLVALSPGIFSLDLPVVLRFPFNVPGFYGELQYDGVIHAVTERPAPDCIAAPNSVGPGAHLGMLGSTSISANDLVLLGEGLPPFAPGLFFYGDERTMVPLGDGYLCIAGPQLRLRTVYADQLGYVATHLDQALLPPAGHVQPGQTWHFQLWYRDPAGGPAGNNLSDVLSLLFLP